MDCPNPGQHHHLCEPMPQDLSGVKQEPKVSSSLIPVSSRIQTPVTEMAEVRHEGGDRLSRLEGQNVGPLPAP